MQIKLAGWILILFIVVIASGAIWYFLFLPKPVTQTPTQQSSVTLPASGSSTQVPTPTSSQTVPNMSVPTQNGSVLVTNDFIHNNSTVEDPSNAGNYYLTGSSTQGFAIGYRTPSQFFTIALEKEPLSQTRKDAENFLLSVLGISQSDLCSLNYYIGTDIQTNSLFAGKNLGFSFCPGATVLP